jgi:hypothetical protein
VGAAQRLGDHEAADSGREVPDVASVPRQPREGFGAAPENLPRAATVAGGDRRPESLGAQVPRQPRSTPLVGAPSGATLENVPRRSMRELAEDARALGHTLHVDRRDFDEYDAPPKFYVTCTCGYAATVRRTEKAALEVAAWHIGKAVGESGEIFRRNGVVSPRAARA